MSMIDNIVEDIFGPIEGDGDAEDARAAKEAVKARMERAQEVDLRSRREVFVIDPDGTYRLLTPEEARKATRDERIRNGEAVEREDGPPPESRADYIVRVQREQEQWNETVRQTNEALADQNEDDNQLAHARDGILDAMENEIAQGRARRFGVSVELEEARRAKQKVLETLIEAGEVLLKAKSLAERLGNEAAIRDAEDLEARIEAIEDSIGKEVIC